jgi:hypothetical protein
MYSTMGGGRREETNEIVRRRGRDKGRNREKRQSTEDRDEIESKRERGETDRQYRGKMEQEWQSRHRVGETVGEDQREETYEKRGMRD